MNKSKKSKSSGKTKKSKIKSKPKSFDKKNKNKELKTKEPKNKEPKNKELKVKANKPKKEPKFEELKNPKNPNVKNVLIVFPFGNLHAEEKRDEQLNKILLEMSKLIKDADCPDCYIKYFLLVSEQIAPQKYFNRGQLLNIGLKYFEENIGHATHLILHDVDIIPDKKMFAEYTSNIPSYSLMPTSSEEYIKAYGSFILFTGSAVYLTKPEIFIRANGYPNNFWGWGGEDNELHKRYEKNGHMLVHNKNNGSFTSTDKQRNSNADKMSYLKKNELRNMMVRELWKENEERWRENGYNQMSNLNYIIVEEKVEEYGNYSIIRIKSQLDETDLEKTIEHNNKVYEEIQKSANSQIRKSTNLQR